MPDVTGKRYDVPEKRVTEEELIQRMAGLAAELGVEIPVGVAAHLKLIPLLEALFDAADAKNRG